MLFLIEYDRPLQATVLFEEFTADQREKAEYGRLQIEQANRERGIDREVVILDAESREALEVTHGRYVDGLRRVREGLEPRDVFRRAEEIEKRDSCNVPEYVVIRRYQELMLEFGLIRQRRPGDPGGLPCAGRTRGRRRNVLRVQAGADRP